eukprot:2545493-Amphidinium_carterae.1
MGGKCNSLHVALVGPTCARDGNLKFDCEHVPGRGAAQQRQRLLKRCYPLTGAHAHLQVQEVRAVTRAELLELQTQWDQSCRPADLKPAYRL